MNSIACASMAIRRNGLSLHLVIALGVERAGFAGFHGARRAWRRLRCPLQSGHDSFPASVRKSLEAIGPAQQRMWELALHLEEGQTERTARTLDEARQAARDALDMISQSNDANPRGAGSPIRRESRRRTNATCRRWSKQARRAIPTIRCSTRMATIRLTATSTRWRAGARSGT